jgi:hypothetical protein
LNQLSFQLGKQPPTTSCSFTKNTTIC